MTDPTTAVRRPAADAVETVISEATAREEPLNLGVLTDEEVHMYASDPAAEGPYGVWFAGLPEEGRQAASLGAMRALTSRGEVDSSLSEDEEGDVRLPTQLVAAVVLRRLDAQLSLRVLGGAGDTWYVLRHVRDELFLREAITPQGFHFLSVVRLDDTERDVYLERYQLPSGVPAGEAPEVDVTLTEAEIHGASIGTSSQLGFLDQTAFIGNLARTAADGRTSTSMVHVLTGGGLVVAEVGRERVHYIGATSAALVSGWDEWRAVMSSRVGTGDVAGLAARPELLTEPAVANRD